MLRTSWHVGRPVLTATVRFENMSASPDRACEDRSIGHCWGMTSLPAPALVCTLKRSGHPSSSELLASDLLLEATPSRIGRAG